MTQEQFNIEWSAKQIEFNQAMTAYESVPIYMSINHVVSYLNISLQWLLVLLAVLSGVEWYWHIAMLVLAFVVADFVNGLVHLYMDHNDAYTSRVGPFIATFHLHHDTPRYQDKPIWRVYIDESGSKIWLVFVLMLCVTVDLAGSMPSMLLCFLAYFCVWSSVAEVSHYLCHNSQATWVRALQKLWILLPNRHHMRHHRLDNVNYAFLNGMSDPLINRIAARLSRGYRTTTDLHTALYQQKKNDSGSHVKS